MRPLHLTLIIVVISLIAGAFIHFFVLSEALDDAETEVNITNIKMGRAGDSGYVVFNNKGDINISLISLESEPYRKLIILNDTNGMGMDKLPRLMAELDGLKDYGYETVVSNKQHIGEGLYLIPTGAIPYYVYDDLWHNDTNSTILFLGHSDLVIRNGIKKENWYDTLSQEQKERVRIYNSTMEEYLESDTRFLLSDILTNAWAVESIRNFQYNDGHHTAEVNMSRESGYLRMIYENSKSRRITDSSELPRIGRSLSPKPPDIFHWQKSNLSFELNRTSGMAKLSVFKNNELVMREDLRRVTDDNFFIKNLEFDEPGNYIIDVSDNQGRIASGILHIKDLDIELIDRAGVSYIFNITADGKPLNSTEVSVSLNNGTQTKDFYVTEGLLKINAKLQDGTNIFNIGILGTTIPVEVEHEGSSLLRFYIIYGLPGLAIVGLVFLVARMSRRPVYRIRFSDVGSQIRKEVRLDSDDAISSFKKIRKDMNLQKSPITAEEFSIALKRYITNGCEMTSGNVEEILNKLCKNDILESHQGYYQLAGEGDVKHNALMRMIREKLIENGIPFKVMKNKVSTKDYEIGFYGGKFKKKALIILDDEGELRSIMNRLDEKEKCRLKIKESNNMVVFVPISRLVEYL